MNAKIQIGRTRTQAEHQFEIELESSEGSSVSKEGIEGLVPG
jgi:hypothetical protein